MFGENNSKFLKKIFVHTATEMIYKKLEVLVSCNAWPDINKE